MESRNHLIGDVGQAVMAGAIHGGVHLHAAAPSGPHRYDQLPLRAAAFQARDLPLGDGCTILVGMGGAGKTQIAADAAHRARAEGIEPVWIIAGSRDQVKAAYADLAARVSGVERSVDDAVRWYLGWLDDHPHLIVLDDVAAPADVHGLIPSGRVIVTTRDRGSAWRADGRDIVEVDLFTHDQARACLASWLEDHPHLLDGADDLVTELGHLPLAVAHAGAYLVDLGITCADYLDRFRAHHSRLPDLFPDDHDRVVATTWTLSIARANERRPVGLALPLMRLLSFLDPAGIPLQLLTSPTLHEYLGADKTQVHDAAHGLARLNLLSIDTHPAAAGVAICLHALVQRATREAGPPDAEIETAAEALCEIWPDVETDAALADALRHNATALGRNAEQAHPNPLWTPKPHDALILAGRSWKNAGQFTAARDHFTALLDYGTRVLELDAADCWPVRYFLADIRGHTGDATGAARDCRALLAELDPDERTALAVRGDIARWVGEAGDAKGASGELRALLADQERMLPPDDRETLTNRANIAHLRGVTGDVAGALAELRAVLGVRERVLGVDHPDTLGTRHRLAYFRDASGDSAGALVDGLELLTDLQRVFGPDHPDVLLARANAAGYRGGAGDPAGAVAEFEVLVADRLRLFPPDHPATLHDRENLAYWRGQSGDLHGALTAYRALLADRERILGPGHLHTVECRLGVAVLRHRAGDAIGALDDLDAVVAGRHRLVGPDDKLTLSLRRAAATWRFESGDPVSALAEARALAADQARVLGPDHPETSATRYHLAVWRQASGDTAGALADFEALLPDQRQGLGHDHPQTLSTRHHLIRLGSGDAKAKHAAIGALLLDFVAVFGADDPQTLMVRDDLAYQRAQCGDLAGALADFEALLPEEERVLGADHPTSIGTRHYISVLRSGRA
ncbi:tetratricopeptide repeat protein [Actinokineospora auranticolor]|uniref:Tetratricopeptide repeat protein n=1 Tax=Actinokineospora auranticolor TaxID=155976 RepID=A0A2S6H0E2_9PSEU|nr:tetratricopeptide repeat protein [Actinokineospora auranticolor]PPK70870.1 tetratricopeptide repeat protein [Actinokineospora auranticolor]